MRVFGQGLQGREDGAFVCAAFIRARKLRSGLNACPERGGQRGCPGRCLGNEWPLPSVSETSRPLGLPERRRAVPRGHRLHLPLPPGWEESLSLRVASGTAAAGRRDSGAWGLVVVVVVMVGWWPVFCPAQVPNLPGGKVGGVDKTTCSSCTPGGVFESNPGLEGPAWSLRLTALGVWRARRRRAASLSRVPGTPTFHVLLRQLSDSCVAQVPPPPTPHTRNAAFEVILPAGLGGSEVSGVVCATSFVFYSAKPRKAPGGFTTRFCSHIW